MSVRSERAAEATPSPTDSIATLPAITGEATGAPMDHVNATITAAQSADTALGEANSISTNHPEHPLRRSLVVNIRASLADLTLRKNRGTWAPSGEAMRSIMQYAHASSLPPLPAAHRAHATPSFHAHAAPPSNRQKKFTGLDGTAEQVGDLKSVVLHNLKLSSVSSDFSVPVGMRVTGVDNSTFSLTGEAFSSIVPPNTSSTAERTLQSDDVALGMPGAHRPWLRPLPRLTVHACVCSQPTSSAASFPGILLTM